MTGAGAGVAAAIRITEIRMRSYRQSMNFGSESGARAAVALVTALAVVALAACSPGPAGTGDASASAAGGQTFGANADGNSPVPNGPPVEVRPLELPPGAIRLQRAQIVDPSGFEKPLVAATLLIPAGYRPQGGIVWNMRAKETCSNDYAVEWSAATPDGQYAIGFTSARRWNDTRSFGNGMQLPLQPGCVRASFSNAREFLEGWARGTYPDMRVLDYRPRPDLAAPAQPYVDMMNEVQASTPVRGMQSKHWVDGGELLIAHAVNGVEVRETIATGVVVSLTRWTDYMSGQPSNEALSGYPGQIQYVRAPEGRLEFRLAEIVRASQLTAPEWGRRIFEHNQKQIAITNQGLNEQHRIRMDAMREEERIRNGQFDANMLMQDRAQRERIEQIRGVETYRDPATGGPVQLSNQYEHAWRLRDDTYVLTNDVNFDPTRFGIEAQKMQAVP